MTKHELQCLRHYDSELRILRQHLAELEASVGISSMEMDGQPHGTKIGRPTELQAITIADTIAQIRDLEERITLARNETWSFIVSLEDPLLRQIITLRFIDGKSWQRVADAIGGGASADNCRKIYVRSNIAD